jgi:hypothetical protein
MKENFKHYGQVITFDLTFNMIKNVSDGKKWKIGAFLSTSCSKKIVPLGLAAILEETS